MTKSGENHADTFRRLHAAGAPLVLPNAWDAGSARLIEANGAAAIATTSSGVAWSHGYPDGDALPPRVLAAAVEEIVRVLSVPLTVDAEGGYSSDPGMVGEAVFAIASAGAVGINLEDGSASRICCARRSPRQRRLGRGPASISSSTRGPTSTCAAWCRRSGRSKRPWSVAEGIARPAATACSCRD